MNNYKVPQNAITQVPWEINIDTGFGQIKF